MATHRAMFMFIFADAKSFYALPHLQNCLGRIILIAYENAVTWNNESVWKSKIALKQEKKFSNQLPSDVIIAFWFVPKEQQNAAAE